MNTKKFEGILLCSDIDGTLFYYDPELKRGYVPENVCRAIRYFQENGGRFTLATGRFPLYAATALTQYVTPNAPLITLNGAVIYDAENEKILFSAPIIDDPCRLSYDVIVRYPHMKRVDMQCGDGHSYSFTLEEGLREYSYKSHGSEPGKLHPVKTRDELTEFFADKIIYKVLYIFPEEYSESARDSITADFPEYAVARSWINGVELQRADADKGSSTRRLAEMLGDVKLLVCVGDFENDISMIKNADIGYAVNDSIDGALAAAHRITKRTCKEGAIEEIIEELERELCGSSEN